MEKCQSKNLLYNNKTKRCYKTCEQKKKETHPITKKCRQKCKGEKIRRIADFRCVKKTLKVKKAKAKKTTVTKVTTPIPKAVTPKASAERIKPAEEIVPPPLQKKLEQNLEFINDLVSKGKDKTIDFRGRPSVSDIISIYFHEKYKKHCPMYPIKTYTMFDTKDFKERFNARTNKLNLEQYKPVYAKINGVEIDWDINKFLKKLKLCLDTGEQLILIPLRVPRHLNMLIIKVSTREIIRFEPHGATFHIIEENSKINSFLENLTNEINVYLKLNRKRKFKFVEPREICPRTKFYFDLGFQVAGVIGKEKAEGESGGFCQLWSWFFAECVINNPDMPIDKVYKAAHNMLKDNPENYAAVIRGYFISINEELIKMKHAFSINKTYVNTLKHDNDILLAYLNKSNVKLLNKPKKPFSGGV
jgi:hypothetical protein